MRVGAVVGVVAVGMGMGTAARAGEDVRVSEPGQALAEVIIDVNPLNPDNLVIAAYASTLVIQSTFHSFDGGRTWTWVPVGDAQDGLGNVDRYDPTLVFDGHGVAFMGYGARVLTPTGTNDHLLVCRSVDGGRSWEQATLVWAAVDVNALAGNDKFHLAAGRDRLDPSRWVVYMAWTWNVAPQFGFVNQQISVARSPDSGRTFSPPVVVNEDAMPGSRDFALFADPGVGPNGEVYVCWNELNEDELRVDVSMDGGRTWGVDVTVEPDAFPFRTRIKPQPNRGVFAGPVLDVDVSDGPHRGRVYITYLHGNEEDTDILVRHSDDRAQTWSAPVRVNDDAPGNFQFLPWLDTDPISGKVGVAFYDTRSDTARGQSTLYYAVSQDGGESFGANVAVADVPSDNSSANLNRYPGNFLEYIGLAMWNSTAYLAWTDTRNAPIPLTDYYFDRLLIDTTAPEIDVTLDPSTLWPPNQRVVAVRATVTVQDDFDTAPEVVLESIVSDEPAGAREADIEGAETGTFDVDFRLRASRDTRRDGRTYTIVYRATDDHGNTARDTAFVHVPHDRAGGGNRVAQAPPATRLGPVYPNPFRGTATIAFEVAARGEVHLEVYDVQGRRVRRVLAGSVEAGPYTAVWDGTDGSGRRVAAGVYFVRLTAHDASEVRKLVRVE